MSLIYPVETERLQEYAYRCSLELTERVGFGQDGIVWMTTRPSAIKALRYAEHYSREVEVYERLRKHNIKQINGFSVPRMIRNDDELWIVEMTLVTPPFVLDFAGAALDRPPAHANEPEMIQMRYEKW